MQDVSESPPLPLHRGSGVRDIGIDHGYGSHAIGPSGRVAVDNLNVEDTELGVGPQRWFRRAILTIQRRIVFHHHPDTLPCCILNSSHLFRPSDF